MLQARQARNPGPHQSCDVVEVRVEQDKLWASCQVGQAGDVVVTHVEDLQRRHLPQEEHREACQVVPIEKEELETGQVLEAALQHQPQLVVVQLEGLQPGHVHEDAFHDLRDVVVREVHLNQPFLRREGAGVDERDGVGGQIQMSQVNVSGCQSDAADVVGRQKQELEVVQPR